MSTIFGGFVTKLNEKIFNMFKEMSKRLYKFEREVGKDVGLNNSETKVIVCLNEKPGLTHKELGEVCNADKAAMSRILNKMEQKELILSNHDSNNRKTLHNKLTEHGKKIAERIKEMHRKHSEKYFSKLSQQEYNILTSIISKLLGTAEV